MSEAVVADGKGPLPDFPDSRAAVGREEDDLCLADEILERHVAYVDSAVGGIVPIVPHHEVFALGNHINLGSIEVAFGIAVEHVVAYAIGKSLAVARDISGLFPDIFD